MKQTSPAPDFPFNPATVLTSGLELCVGFCELASAYADALARARSFDAVMQANAELVGRSLDIPALAVGGLLRDTGVTAPLLNDA